MGWMRRERKSLSSLLGFALVLLLGSLGHAEGFLLKQIDAFNTYQIPIDLGGQSSATVSILASDQTGDQMVYGTVQNIWTEDNHPPQRLGPQIMWNTLNLNQGQIKQARVYYLARNYVPVVIRAWASQGNMFNTGTLIITDNINDPNQATFRYTLRAQGELPLWRILLGLALWLIPGGQIGTILLWGNTSNSGSTTIAIPPDVSSKTIYYKYTGCTAAADYDGSFTLYASAPAGQAIVLNVQGWCGGVGAGNWARVSQVVAVPTDFHSFATSGLSKYVFGTPSYRVFAYYLGKTAKVTGPDDCGGTYTDLYPASGGGINFVISGADCDSNMWGAPGKPGTSYTSVPSLTLIAAIDGGWGDMYGTTFTPPVSYQYSLSWTNKTFTYQPSPYISGNASTTPVSSQLPDGTVVYGKAVQFSPSGYTTDGMAIVAGSSIGIGRLPSLTIPSRSPKCTFKNNSSNYTYTVYLLDPPGTYSLSSLPGGMVPAQTSQLNPRASAVYPPGFYLVLDSSGGVVYPGGNLSITGCTYRESWAFGSGDDIEVASISPGFLAY
jgi:hypothetical protein